jgi:hypothetical protein
MNKTVADIVMTRLGTVAILADFCARHGLPWPEEVANHNHTGSTIVEVCWRRGAEEFWGGFFRDRVADFQTYKGPWRQPHSRDGCPSGRGEAAMASALKEWLK